VKVVLDTNILISAFVFPGGQGERALNRIVEGRDQLLISLPLVHELLGVLGRKFGREQEELSRVAVFLADLGEMIHSRQKLRVLDDEADNRILECAMAGEADVIVTGDRAMLKLQSYRGIHIISLSGYLANS
jgi:putative PIN family toxin of toxin-antitoxin system